MESDFYLRYYVGHKGKFGHEFLEFEFRPDGKSGLPAAGSGTGPGEGGEKAGCGMWRSEARDADHRAVGS